jgi:hypothetical protein
MLKIPNGACLLVEYFSQDMIDSKGQRLNPHG